MKVSTFTSKRFNVDTGAAKIAAKDGPVFVTNHGRPTHVLLAIDDYRRITHSETTLLDALACADDGSDFDLRPPTIDDLAFVFGAR